MGEFTKSPSGRLQNQVHKWTDHPKGCLQNSLVHWWTSLLRSPQVDKFITRSLSGRVHYEVYLSGQSHYQVHNWTSLILSPQKGRVKSNK